MVTPRIIFGTGGVTKPAQLLSAFNEGFEIFDLATVYGNESAFRIAFQNSQAPKIIYKVQPYRIREQIERAKNLLHTNVFEAVALHHVVLGEKSPSVENILEVWEDLESLVLDKTTENLGLSNAGAAILEILYDHARIFPQFSQFECHPDCFDRDLINLCHSLGVIPMGFSPLMGGKFASVAADCIAWLTGAGVVPIVRSCNPEHLRTLIGALVQKRASEMDILNVRNRIWKDGLKQSGLFGKVQGKDFRVPDLAAYLSRSSWMRKNVDKILQDHV